MGMVALSAILHSSVYAHTIYFLKYPNWKHCGVKLLTAYNYMTVLLLGHIQ